MNRMLLAGASGFIGRHCLAPLSAQGYEIHAVTSKLPPPGSSGIHWHQADLLNRKEMESLLGRVQPSHLLHLAWYMEPGKYAESLSNFQWVQASMELLRLFHEQGGQRVVMAGSSFEYDWNYGYCSENITPRVPTTLYGKCKNALYSLVEGYARAAKLSSAWARIFFLYGPYEDPRRLVSSVICSILKGEPARCSHGGQIRDYLHVQDAADALVGLVHSGVQGAVNIAGGYHYRLKDIILAIGKKLNREDLILLGAVPARPNDVPVVVADVTRLLTEVGWQPKYDLDQGLDDTIQWWKQQVAGTGMKRGV